MKNLSRSVFVVLFLVGAFSANVSVAAAPEAAKPHDIGQMGLKNFREILNSLATVTGIPASNANVLAYYNQIIGALPRNGNLAEFNAQSFLAAIGLGSVFCNEVITKDLNAVAKTGPDTGIDFQQGPSKVTAAARKTLIQNYINLFLQRAPSATELDQLTKLFAAQIDSKDTVDETQAAVVSVCSAIAGSIEFLSN